MEPGENIKDETYNGVPFEVGQRWVEKVPDIGEFTAYYTTKNGCAHLGVRIELANRLLMPGRGRWRCIPERLVVEDHLMNPECFEIAWDEEGMDLMMMGPCAHQLACNPPNDEHGEMILSCC